MCWFPVNIEYLERATYIEESVAPEIVLWLAGEKSISAQMPHMKI